jgi:acetyl esterase/lipase
MSIRKFARVLTVFVAAVLLSWTSLLYVRLRAPHKGMMWLAPKVFAGTFSLETALIGVAGSLLGAMGGSLSVVFEYAMVALAGGIPLLRTWRTPEVITATFGAIEPPAQRRRYWIARRWGMRLGSVPEGRVQRDIPFWTIPEVGRVLLCDIWQPPVAVPSSGLGLVYLHGSAWTLLDKDCGTRGLFSHLVAQGHVVMDVAYRLYPETDLQGMVGDAKRAVAWLRSHAAAYGIDPQRIVLSGASAGGHVALLAAYTNSHPALTSADVSEVDTSVRGVMGWYSPVDLQACYEHYENTTLAEMMPDKPDWNSPPTPWMRRILGTDAERLALQKGPAGGRLDWIIGGTPQEAPEEYALLSPLTHVGAGCPPTLLMQGRDDFIVPPGPTLELQQKLRAAGVQAAVLLLPYADHAFDLFGTGWSPMARQALWHAERFLEFVASRQEASDRGETPEVATAAAGRRGGEQKVVTRG